MKLSKKEWIAVVVSLIVITLFFYPFISQNFFQSSLVGDSEELSHSESLGEASTEDLIDLEVLDNITTEGSFQDTEDAETDAFGGVRPGDFILVHYTGKLSNGEVFDSSLETGSPIQFRVGDGRLIDGFEEGVIGMKAGEIKEIVIPPEKGYGDVGVINRETGEYTIPPNETIVFEVELIEVRRLEVR